MRLRHDVLERWMGALSRLIERHPWKIIIAHAAAAVASTLVAAFGLEFNTDQNELVSNDLEYNQRYLGFLREFGDLEFLYVVIDPRQPERGKAIADAVAEELRRIPRHVQKVFHRVEVEAQSALLFLPGEIIEQAAAFIAANQAWLRELLDVDGLSPTFEFIASHLDGAAARSQPRLAALGFQGFEAFLRRIESALDGAPPEPLSLESICAASRRPHQTLDALVDDPVHRQLWSDFCSGGYLASGGLFFVLVLPQKDFQTLEVIREPLREIRAAVSRVAARFPEDRIGLTGRPVLQADEMETTNRDMMRVTIFSALAVVGLFMFFFREVLRPALAALSLAVAIALTFGLVTVTLGHLNLLTLVFAVMLVGMGMEFGNHFIARYQEELAATSSVVESIRNTLLTTGKGNLTGAATTAAAFYTSLLVDFKGLSELGFIAGTGVLICLWTMDVLLPALILVFDRRRPSRRSPAPLRMGFLSALAQRPLWALGISAALVLIGLPWLRSIRFDANLLKLQAAGLPSVEFEKLILEKSGIKTWFAASIVSAEDEKALDGLIARYREDRLAHAIGKVESIRDHVPPDQEQKIARIRQAAADLGIDVGGDAPLPLWRHRSAAAAFDAPRLERALGAVSERLESFLSGAARAGDEGVEELERLIDSIERIRERLRQAPEIGAQRIAAFEKLWGEGLDAAFRETVALLDPRPLVKDDLDPFLKSRVISASGRHYLVHIYPREDIWKEEAMAAFIAAIREVDPQVTGVPVQVYESTRLMERGFLLAAVYSFVVVLALIWFDFRSVLFTLLAMVPVVLGLVWVAQLMPALGMAFNLANFFSIPILIGGGIDGGVHIIHRFREDRSARVATRSTGVAVVLSFLNNLIGFGMLVFASHRGLASLGAMMALGSATCLVASVIVLPALLKLIERRRWHVESESSS